MKKNLFEMWNDKEFPEELQKEIDGFANNGKTNAERIFRAGFHCGHKIKKIREVLGIED